jgi:hypothetical protein
VKGDDMIKEYKISEKRANKIITGNTEERMKKGMWALFIEDEGGYITLAKVNDMFDIEDILKQYMCCVSHIWINGEQYKAELNLVLTPSTNNNTLSNTFLSNIIYKGKKK